MKIIDCFTFYNEINMLKYRLEILTDIVDYFVIVEATHTHSGHAKKMYFEENKELFAPYLSKIIHIIVDDFKHIYPNINYNNAEQWINENYQRNCIKNGLNKLELVNEDIIIITDLDEIPDPNTLQKIKDGEIIVDVNILEQDFYYYNLNTIHNTKWHLSKIILYKKLCELGISCNDIRINNNYPIIKNGGWHLSYFGDALFIQNKIQQFSHQELNNECFTNLEYINEKIKLGVDLYNRSWEIFNRISIKDNLYLPPSAEIYLTNYYTF